MDIEQERKLHEDHEKHKSAQQSLFEKKHQKFLEQLNVLNETEKQQQQRATEQKRKINQTNHEFVSALNEAIVTIPDQVVDHNLEKAGCDCPDLRVKRLIAIAAKKMIFEVCKCAKAHRQHHIQGLPASKRKALKNKAQTLEMEHLLMALRDKGIYLNKPPFYVSDPKK